MQMMAHCHGYGDMSLSLAPRVWNFALPRELESTHGKDGQKNGLASHGSRGFLFLCSDGLVTQESLLGSVKIAPLVNCNCPRRVSRWVSVCTIFSRARHPSPPSFVIPRFHHSLLLLAVAQESGSCSRNHSAGSAQGCCWCCSDRMFPLNGPRTFCGRRHQSTKKRYHLGCLGR